MKGNNGLGLARELVALKVGAHVGGILTHGGIYSCAVTPLSHVALFIRHPILSLSRSTLDAGAAAGRTAPKVILHRMEWPLDFTTTRRSLMFGVAGAASLSAQTGAEIRTAFIGTGNRGRSLVRQVLERRANLQFLGLSRADVIQVKAFLRPMSSADVVQQEVREFFGSDAPPVVLVEWISKAPIEIELVARSTASGGPAIEYLTPPEEKRPRVFTRIVRIAHPKTLYVSGIYGTAGADAATQVREIFASLKDVLIRAGSDLRHLVKATYYVSENNTSRLLNELRPECYEDGRAPAASKAMVRGTGFDGRTIALDMIAVPAM